MERCTKDEVTTFLEATLVKQADITNRAAKVEMDPDADVKKPNVTLDLRLKNAIMIVVERLAKQDMEFDYNLFTLILQNLCFQVTCPSVKGLRAIFT